MIEYIIAGVVAISLLILGTYRSEQKAKKLEQEQKIKENEMIREYPKGSKYVVTEYIPFAEMAL